MDLTSQECLSYLGAWRTAPALVPPGPYHLGEYQLKRAQYTILTEENNKPEHPVNRYSVGLKK